MRGRQQQLPDVYQYRACVPPDPPPEVDGGARGRFALVANPVQFAETPPRLRRGPEMGEHTDEVLRKLGLTMEELATSFEKSLTSPRQAR
jgi:hypothetical protein